MRVRPAKRLTGLYVAPCRACSFQPRHNSGTEQEIEEMVSTVGYDSLSALIDATVPASIRRKDNMDMKHYTQGMTESEFLDYFRQDRQLRRKLAHAKFCVFCLC
jgi:glycine cleavage system pyridoxal-binding protein P